MVQYAITLETGEVFTFPDGMVKRCTPNIVMNDSDKNVMPGNGPMGNEMYDYGGVVKTITVSGELFDVPQSVSNMRNITTIKLMKYWLEGQINGSQSAKLWTSPLDEYSLESSDGQTEIDGVMMPGTWVPTKVYITNLDFPDAEEHVGNTLPFTLTLEVVGI